MVENEPKSLNQRFWTLGSYLVYLRVNVSGILSPLVSSWMVFIYHSSYSQGYTKGTAKEHQPV